MRNTSGKGTRNKIRATGRSIPPATAYAFITIHEISEEEILRVSLRVADGIEAADRGVGRERREEARGYEEEDFSAMRRENILSKQKQSEPSPLPPPV